MDLEYERYFYGGDDFLDELEADLKLPSLLDGADASPSEILAQAAPPIISPLVSPPPQLSPLSDTADRSISDSSSEDDSKNSGWESGCVLSSSPASSCGAVEPTRPLDLRDVEQFLATSDKVPGQIIRNGHKGPVMSIENGVIKVENMKQELSDVDGPVLKPLLISAQPLPYSGARKLSPQYKVESENTTSNGLSPRDGTRMNANGNYFSLDARTQNKYTRISENIPNHEGLMKAGKVAIPQMPKPAAHVPNVTTVHFKVVAAPLNGVSLNGSGRVMNSLAPAAPPPLPDLSPPSSPLAFDTTNLSTLEVRAIKKQQRMIKNRESASLSRKKKKDYVSSLEAQLAEARQEVSRLRLENSVLREQLQSVGRLARKIPRLDPSSLIPRKNVAVIFAMIFMVSLNWNGFGWSNEPTDTPAVPVRTSRQLLWSEDSSAEIVSPVRPGFEVALNGSGGAGCGNGSRAGGDELHIEQTESLRLAGELQRWLGGAGAPNRTLRDHALRADDVLNAYKLLNKLNIPPHLLPMLDASMGADAKPTPKQKPARSRLRRVKEPDYQENAVVDYDTVYPKRIGNHRRGGYDMLEEFGEWTTLLRALPRREDTFYVVGVGRGEHLLLPATAHNDTRPPRMALILPANTRNESTLSEHITLMQIDCSVVNTSFVKLKANAIPESLRRTSDAPPAAPADKGTSTTDNRDRATHTKSTASQDASLYDVLHNSSTNTSTYPKNGGGRHNEEPEKGSLTNFLYSKRRKATPSPEETTPSPEETFRGLLKSAKAPAERPTRP